MCGAEVGPNDQGMYSTVQNTNIEYSTIIGKKKVLDAAMRKPDTRRCNTLHDLTHRST